jgi:hypothetical protein
MRIGRGSPCLRPDLDPSFIRVTIADDVHVRFRELDDTFFLQFLDSLNDAYDGEVRLVKSTEKGIAVSSY